MLEARLDFQSHCPWEKLSLDFSIREKSLIAIEYDYCLGSFQHLRANPFRPVVCVLGSHDGLSICMFQSSEGERHTLTDLADKREAKLCRADGSYMRPS